MVKGFLKNARENNMYFIIFFDIYYENLIVEQALPEKSTTWRVMGPSLPRSETPGSLCMGRAKTACKLRNVVDVVQQNLASYRKDFKDGAKGYVLQQGGVHRNRKCSELFT